MVTTTQEGTPICCLALLGRRGRLVLPARVRARLGLKEGDRLLVRTEPDGSIRLLSLHGQVEKVRGLYRDVESGVSWAAEVIRERREEADGGRTK